MRIVLHAGLHKSGTTHVQSWWGHGYAGHPTVRYPMPDGAGPVAVSQHQYLTWGLLGAFTEARAPHLVLAQATRRDRLQDLATVVSDAARDGVAALVISSEDLDLVQPDDVPGLRAALGAHRVTVAVTVTNPMHRWCSGWQTMVKRGLAAHPREAAPMLENLAALTPGRLEQVLRLLPASERVVRLVRTSPPEERLARDLAVSLGLPDPGDVTEGLAHNRSLGTDVEVLRRINAADLACGLTPAGREHLARLRGDGFTHEDAPELAAHYEPSARMREAAAVEQAFLAAPPADLGLRVDDPLGLLPGWLDAAPPPWYTEVSRRRAVLPELDAAQVPDVERVWRLHQERDALRERLDKTQQQSRRRARRVKELEAHLEARLEP